MRIIFILLFFVINCPSYSQVKDTIYLWPDKVQSEEKSAPTVLPDRGDGVIRITDVSAPALMVFPIAEAKNTGAAVIVCPGGAFRHLSLNKEGYEVAEWLKSLGISAFVLQYSVPNQHDQAGADIQRAMRIVRSRAGEWGIDPQKLGVIGFSAGGSLGARVSEVPEKNTYNRVDLSDNVSSVPDFAMLIYPSGMGNANERPTDLSFEEGAPPMFIFCTADDRVANYGSLYLTEKLYRSGIHVELHVLPEGGHGYGLRTANIAARTWPPLAEKWLHRYILN